MPSKGPHRLKDGRTWSAFFKELMQRRIAEGTFHGLDREWQRERSRRLVAEGRCLLQGESGSAIQHHRLDAGTHPFQGLRTCPHCGKEGTGAVMLRWHFDNCKARRAVPG